MKIARPLEPTIVSTNVVNTYSDLPSAGPYNLDDIYVYENKVYQVVADPSTNDLPDAGIIASPPTWALLGWSNQYRMFKDGSDSVSTKTEEIDVVLNYDSSVSIMAIFGIVAESIQLTVTDPVAGEVYNQTIDLADIGVQDWWEYYFLDYEVDGAAIFEGIPPYPDSDYHLEVFGASPSSVVEVGRVVAGTERELGVSLFGTSITLKDYSIKERDGFGTLTLVERRKISIVDYDVHVDTENVDATVRFLKELLSTPCLVIGEADYTSTVVYGLIADVQQGITTPSVSDLTLRVEEF